MFKRFAHPFNPLAKTFKWFAYPFKRKPAACLKLTLRAEVSRERFVLVPTYPCL